MKFVLFFLINIIFSGSLSEWIKSNYHIFDSGLYKISFDQKMESIIGGESHYVLDENTSVIFSNNQIRYESSDRIIIANKDSLKLLNKKNSQLFIDYSNQKYNFLFQLDLIKILEDNDFIKFRDSSYYYLELDNSITSKIYFKNNRLDIIKIIINNMNLQLSNFNFLALDTSNINKYFNIEDMSLFIFDLRAK